MKSADEQNWEMLLRFPVFTFYKFPEKKFDDSFVMRALMSAVFASDHRSSSVSLIVMVNVYSTFI